MYYRYAIMIDNIARAMFTVEDIDRTAHTIFQYLSITFYL